MAGEPQNGLAFNHDLSMEMNIIGQTPNTRGLRVDDIIDVHTVDPKDANGKWYTDRTTVDEADEGVDHLDIFLSPGQIPKHTHGSKPSTTDYLCRVYGPPARRCNKRSTQRDHVPLSERRRAAITRVDKLAQINFKLVSGLYVPANYSSRNDTAANIAPDGLTIDDPTHNPIEFWLAAKQLAEDGNADQVPDQLVVSYTYMRKLQVHAGFLSYLGHHRDRDSMSIRELRTYLGAKLDMRVVVKRARGLWGNKAMFMYRGGAESKRLVPGMEDQSDDNPAKYISTRSNGSTLGFDADGDAVFTSVTGALILERLQGGTIYNTGGDPVTWGVFEDFQSHWVDVMCHMSGTVIAPDPKSGYLVTALYA